MAQEAKNETKRISEDQRFHYIGFEVFPGKPKDLFKSDAEREKLVDQVKAKRSSGQIIRDGCTLMLERVSKGEKLVLTAACAIVLVALFMPWYSLYNEVPTAAPAGASTQSASGGQTSAGESANEEVITMTRLQRKMTRTYANKLGIEGLIAIGTVGGAVFSSGLSLMLTGVLFFIMTLACLALPIRTLMALYGGKGDADQQALHLKKYLQYNWIPLVVFVAGLILSLFGGSYGFNAQGTFSSLGAGYSVAAYLGSLSWGFFVAVAAATLLALKGIEI
jgi:hypothetical protein